MRSTDAVLDRFAEEVGESGPVAVEGRQTAWDVGGLPADGTRLVAAPTGIVDYKPEEMTVTVRAGTTVAELHDALAERGQRTALPDRGGTVGGALAVGHNDIRSLGRGLLRTSLLQVRYVSAEGRIISSGGPTVKNVSGFDLPRLIVGSLGTLGLVAEVILRTNPIPATSRWLVSTDADPLAITDTVLAPSAVLWDGSTTWVELEGHSADVDAELHRLATVGTFTDVAVGKDDSVDPGDGDSVEPGDGAVRNAGDGFPVAVPQHRWSLAPADVAGFADRAQTQGIDRFVAAVGLGLVFADRPQPRRTVSPEIQVVADRLKENFDPAGRLNPGRDPGRK